MRPRPSGARLPEVAYWDSERCLREVPACTCGVESGCSTADGSVVPGLGLQVHERSADSDLVTMAELQPLALQLEQLLNPRPREADPEADPEEGEA